MSYKPYKPGKALWYAFLLWLIGFVWGTIVFMVPALKDLPTVPYISKYPAISIPLIIVYFIIVFFISRTYLEGTDKKIMEGLKLGTVIFLVNFILDILVYFILLQSSDYFDYFSIWLSYLVIVAVPWLTGRWLERKTGKE